METFATPLRLDFPAWRTPCTRGAGAACVFIPRGRHPGFRSLAGRIMGRFAALFTGVAEAAAILFGQTFDSIYSELGGMDEKARARRTYQVWRVRLSLGRATAKRKRPASPNSRAALCPIRIGNSR